MNEDSLFDLSSLLSGMINSMGTYENRKVSRTEVDGLVISTVLNDAGSDFDFIANIIEKQL